MEKRNYTCIVCPKSCKGELTIKDDGTFETAGFDCNNGKKYAVNEYTDPKRMLTTTVAIEDGKMCIRDSYQALRKADVYERLVKLALR